MLTVTSSWTTLVLRYSDIFNSLFANLLFYICGFFVCYLELHHMLLGEEGLGSAYSNEQSSRLA